MIILLILAVTVAVMGLGGLFFSRFLSRQWGENAALRTPAVRVNDGRDYVPTPTPVVFAHHFASIAGAGPIIGPVIALCYGWLPALLWILFGGVFVGALHDYLATFMSTRSGGQSVATVARRLLGGGPFVALMLFLVLVLALVCATFLNLSATALVSMVPSGRLGLAGSQTWFRVVGEGAGAQVVIGGIASTSVIVITVLAPLVGWLYIKKHVAVWKCSVLALVICAVSILTGLYWPVILSTNAWKLALSVYVLGAAGVPVWMFLQSRDFINVHILYVGMTVLMVALVVAGIRTGGALPAEAIQPLDVAAGTRAMGFLWPGLFITIACGAVSGFHSLCAGGTTCKQLTSEAAVRRVGYWAMLLESLLAVCVVVVVLVGSTRAGYLGDVHPLLVGSASAANPILGFAMAVGNAGAMAFGVPVAVGALAGMVMLEGFLVTTLDTAVRLMRYLLEEVWRTLFHLPAMDDGVTEEGVGTDGLSTSLELAETSGPEATDPARPVSPLGRFLAHYWVNSGLAVGLMLWFAMSGGILALWGIFATANQLLAAFVLGLGALWLYRRGKRVWYVVAAAAFMLVTTVASLVLLLGKFLPGVDAAGAAHGNPTLFGADLVLLGLSLYLLLVGVREAVRGRSPAAGRRGGARPRR